jgi:hypothetical protein
MDFMAIGLTAVTIATGCGGMPEGAGEDVGQNDSNLYAFSEPGVDHPTLWPGGVIPVCFKNVPNGDNGSNNYSKSLRDAVESKWGRYANITFTGWYQCPEENPGEVVQIIDTQSHSVNPQTDGVGHNVGGPRKMFLSYARWDGCGSNFLGFGVSDWNCFSFTAMHEFGHAIGFKHEQQRSDTPVSCTNGQKFGQGMTDVRLGDGAESPFMTEYDANSIMNYCNSNWNNGGNLSVLDIAGLQAMYGRRLPGNIVAGRGGLSLDSGIPFLGTPGTQTRVMENLTAARFPQLWAYNVSDGTMRQRDAAGTVFCLDDPSGDLTPGSRTNVVSCGSRRVARWELKDMSIRSFGAACLDRPSGSLSDGTKIQLYGCTNGSNQRWTFTTGNELKTNAGASGSKCLDVGTGAAGTQLTIKTCNGSNAQKFDLKSRGEIRSRLNGRCLEAKDKTGKNGTPIQIADCTTSLDNSPTTAFQRLNQLFNFTLTNFKGSGGLCLEQEVTDIARSFSPVKVAGCSGNQNQTWDYYFREQP